MRLTFSAPDPASAPPVDWAGLESFAKRALEALMAGEHPEALVLRDQIAAAEFTELEYTGAGFFLRLRVSADAPRLSQDGVIGDVHAAAPDSDAPLGLLLFVKAGAAEMVEGFAYGTWPADLSPFAFQYVRWDATSDGGVTAVDVAKRDAASMWR